MRILGRLFACSHHAVVEDDRAWIGIAKCGLRMGHHGLHRYPFGLKPLEEPA